MHLPDIGLSLFELDSLQQADALRDGRIDIGILHSPPADAERWLQTASIYTDPLVVALPQSHRLAKRAHVRLADLAADSFVLFPRSSGPALYDDIIARCRSAGFSPRVVQEAVGWNTLSGLAAAAVGVAFVPRSLALLKRPGVIFRPIRMPSSDLEMEMTAVWKRGDRSPVRERFVTVLQAVARARPRPKSGSRT
jgi:DNA-binding transcriptional LysR family regulator